MYPRVPAGIVLDVNTGDNKIRYDLSIQIEGDDSDGINDARILCFDWLVFTCGENHAMDMLWHDNRLFADIDPCSRKMVLFCQSVIKTKRKAIYSIFKY